jgi:putative transposase
VHLAGLTGSPDGVWVVQQAGNLTMALAGRSRPVRFLIHDRDAKFSASFDGVFRAEGARVIRTPIQAPNANACAERWVRTIRSERLDWLLVFGRRQLKLVLRTYIDHYNRQRPHRALDLDAPDPIGQLAPLPRTRPRTVHRRDRLGGLLHEYELAA